MYINIYCIFIYAFQTPCVFLCIIVSSFVLILDSIDIAAVLFEANICSARPVLHILPSTCNKAGSMVLIEGTNDTSQ